MCALPAAALSLTTCAAGTRDTGFPPGAERGSLPPEDPGPTLVEDRALASALGDALEVRIEGRHAPSGAGPWPAHLTLRDAAERPLHLAYRVQVFSERDELVSPTGARFIGKDAASTTIPLDLSRLGPGPHGLRVNLVPDADLAQDHFGSVSVLGVPLQVPAPHVLRSAPVASADGPLRAARSDDAAHMLAAIATAPASSPMARDALRQLGDMGLAGAPATPALVATLSQRLDTSALPAFELASDTIIALERIGDPRGIGTLREIWRTLGPPTGPCTAGGRYCRGRRNATRNDAAARLWADAVSALSVHIDRCPKGAILLNGPVGLVCHRETRRFKSFELGAGFAASDRGLVRAPGARVAAVIGWREPDAPNGPRRPEVIVVPLDDSPPIHVRITVHPDAIDGDLRWPKLRGNLLTVILPRDTATIALTKLPRAAPGEPPPVVEVSSQRCRKRPQACGGQG